MRIFDRRDASLALALVASTLVIFQKPFRALTDAAHVAELRYDIDLLPGLVVLVGTFGFHLYRKQAQTRAAEIAATADAARERRRAGELERLVALGAALANAEDTNGLQQVFWRYLPAFARDHELWMVAKTGDSFEAHRDATRPATRTSEAILGTARAALQVANQADALVNGALLDGYVCFPMTVAEGPLGVVGVENESELTQAERRAVGAAVALIASAYRNIQLLAQTRENSVRDPLTRCFNRAYALETLGTELQRAKRSGQPLSVMMFDVDRFKRLNDDHGHLAGDAVLAAVAAQLNRTLRAGDVKCRWGGDEFLIVLPETPLSGAEHAGGAITREISLLRVETAAGIITPTISVGVAVAEPGESDPMSLIARADEALYKAKHAGRNRFVVAPIRAVG
jgi:diguanylate cyclase (GGDEF)-like protein